MFELSEQRSKQMAKVINFETFTPNKEAEVKSWGSMQEGTVVVALGNETRTVKAIKWHSKHDEIDEISIIAYGFSGRYQTGSKAWPAYVTQYITGARAGREQADFGRDDRHPKFNKMSGIFFAK